MFQLQKKIIVASFTGGSGDLFLTQKRLNLAKIIQNTPGTAGGPGGRDRTVAEKTLENQPFS